MNSNPFLATYMLGIYAPTWCLGVVLQTWLRSRLKRLHPEVWAELNAPTAIVNDPRPWLRFLFRQQYARIDDARTVALGHWLRWVYLVFLVLLVGLFVSFILLHF